jgi:hypothetical protein
VVGKPTFQLCFMPLVVCCVNGDVRLEAVMMSSRGKELCSPAPEDHALPRAVPATRASVRNVFTILMVKVIVQVTESREFVQRLRQLMLADQFFQIQFQ